MEKLLKLKDVAKQLGISYNTLVSWVKNGKLKAIQPGGKSGTWYVTETYIKEFLEQTKTN